MCFEQAQTEAKVRTDLWAVLRLALYFLAPYLKPRHQTHRQLTIKSWQQNFKDIRICYFLLI
jgi:hypothetical protein